MIPYHTRDSGVVQTVARLSTNDKNHSRTNSSACSESTESNSMSAASGIDVLRNPGRVRDESIANPVLTDPGAPGSVNPGLRCTTPCGVRPTTPNQRMHTVTQAVKVAPCQTVWPLLLCGLTWMNGI